MTKRTTKKPAIRKPAAKNKSEQKPAQPAQPGPIMVHSLTPGAFKLVMELIDRADIKGSDAGNVLLLKQELARVSGAQVQAPPK